MIRRHRTALSWLLAFALVLSMVTVPECAAAKDIQLKNCAQTKVMPVGSTFLLSTNQKAAKLKFSSSKKNVVSVNAQGLLQAKKKGTATVTIASGKNKKKVTVKVKNPTGYTISKKAGKYTASVGTKVKAKKGYTVYYTVSKKFKKSWCVSAGKAKTFTFSKTTTLKLYPVKSSVKMTTARLNKTEKTDKNRGDYLYQITPDAHNTPDSTATGGSVGTTGTPSNVPAGTGQPAVPSENPSAGSPSPSVTGGSEDTAPPDVTSPTPGSGENKVQDPLTGYVAPAAADFSEEDTDTAVPEDAVEITIPSTAPLTKVVADTYEISTKNKLTITGAGTFVLKTEGTQDVRATVAINKKVSGVVHLILDGVHLNTGTVIDTTDPDDEGVFNLTNGNDDDSRKIVLTVRDGSSNSIKNTGKTYTGQDGTVYYPVGIHCKKQPLTINGSGELQIFCESGIGIKTAKILKKADGTKVANSILKILDTHITVSGGDGKATAHNGITAKHGIFIKNAGLDISANGDGLKVSLDAEDVAGNAALADLGNMTIDGGSYNITSFSGDAVSAYGTLTLCPERMEAAAKNQAAVNGSRKGIKAGKTIYVPSTAGDIIIDTAATYDANRAPQGSNDPYADDALHCDGHILIEGGNLQISSGDDGITADTGLVVHGGIVKITESYRGLKSENITINDGTITIQSRNDGMNAGSSASLVKSQVIINGGTLTIDAEGDGIDSQGNILFCGGEVIINGPANGQNGALDFGSGDCVCEISGGTLVASGAKGTDAVPTSGSTQPVANIILPVPQQAGTYVVIKDGDGNSVLSAQPVKDFQTVIMSCGQMKTGAAYTVYTGTSLENLQETVSFTFTSACVTVEGSAAD